MSFEGIDYTVQLIALPGRKTNEAVTLNEDGSYTIFIDVKLNAERQKEAFLHAMKHIMGKDFDQSSVNIIEDIAHNQSNFG